MNDEILALKQNILSTLESDVEKWLLEKAFFNLQEQNNEIRLNNFAYVLRELIDKVLKRLAPDNKIKDCAWYAPTRDTRPKFTRKDRIYFSIYGGLTDNTFEELDLIELDTVTNINKIIHDLSKLTHIKEQNKNSKSDIESCALSALQNFYSVFSTLKIVHLQLVEHLKDSFYLDILNDLMSEVVDDIDIYATHHYIDDICIDTLEFDFEPCNIVIRIYGEISAEMQIGSNLDVRRGDGSTFNHSFPFEWKCLSDYDSPGDIELSRENLYVDDSSWRK